MSKNNKKTTKLAPIEARRRVQGTFGALSAPRLPSTKYEDVEFTKVMTQKINVYQQGRDQASLATDYRSLEQRRRATDPLELKRRERLKVDQTRDLKLSRNNHERLFSSEKIRRAVANSNKRRNDVPGVVNKGYLLGGFTFKTAMVTEAGRQFHTTTADPVAKDPDGLLDKRKHRLDEMAHKYVNETHSQFKFPLRDYDKQAGKAWFTTTGLNSQDYKNRGRR